MSPIRSSWLLWLIVVFPLLANAGTTPRPNVLIVSIDSLRRDAVGCYGARASGALGGSPTPNLDRLAAEGVRMERAYTPSPWTLPAHVSLLTGTSPLVHGVETDLQTISKNSVMLAEVLRDAGYRTAGVFSGPYLDPAWGFARGFDRYHAAYGAPVMAASKLGERLSAEADAADERGDTATADELRWLRRAESVRIDGLSASDVSSDTVTKTATDEIDRLQATASPWFLFVHYFDAHYDYVPPPPWDRVDPTYTGSMTGVRFSTNPAIAAPDPNVPDGWVRHVSDRDLDHLRALYSGEVSWVDEHVGRLLRRLDETGVAGRTLVVVVSDHGDEFFEHGGIGHRRNVAEEVIRVPMLLRFPGVLPAGHVESAQASLNDVVPTVLRLVGVNAPRLSGRPLWPPGTALRDLRPLVSRLVRLFDGEFQVDAVRLPIRTALVQESFQVQSIKIVRRRRWVMMPPDLPDGTRAAFEAEANRQFRDEDLQWIDLAQHPDEPESAYSRDFSDRAAHHALGIARHRYEVLQHARDTVLHDALPSSTLRSRLAGLGYLAESAAPTSPRQGFVLPVPRDRRTVIMQ